MRTTPFITFVEFALLLAVILQRAVFGIPLSNKQIANVTGCPRIVSRAEWKARKPLGEKQLEYKPTPYVLVHHGGIRHYCHDQETCAAIVRSYQNFHIDDRGWYDIGYSFVIGEDGNVYEGRGWEKVGAHAPGYNFQSIGICVIGDFTDFLPNKAALQALNSLIACGVSLGKIRKDYNVIGHRQARNTECPGEQFYELVTKLPRWTPNPIPKFTHTTTTQRTMDGIGNLVENYENTEKNMQR